MDGNRLRIIATYVARGANGNDLRKLLRRGLDGMQTSTVDAEVTSVVSVDLDALHVPETKVRDIAGVLYEMVLDLRSIA